MPNCPDHPGILMKTDLLGLGNLWIRKQLSPLLAEIYFPPNNKCLTTIITLLYYFLLLEGYTYVFPGIKKQTDLSFTFPL